MKRKETPFRGFFHLSRTRRKKDSLFLFSTHFFYGPFSGRDKVLFHAFSPDLFIVLAGQCIFSHRRCLLLQFYPIGEI